MKQYRYLNDAVLQALNKKMVFIGGPRQVGKTTLALELLTPPKPSNPSYFNWDRNSDRLKILRDEIPFQNPLLVLDEIHKYKKWRSLVKGLYDKYQENLNIIVTGSARLDHFRKGGDSLMGRYRYFRLHPFSVSELGLSGKDLPDLLQFGGFPEPCLEQSSKNHKIWIRERLYRLVNDDVRDLSTVKEISLIALLTQLLPERVGSPLSLNGLAEDLSVSQPSVDRWVITLENLYYCFRIAPYGSPKVRAVKKLQKLYLWDWSELPNEGSRFENLVASHLLKYCHFIEDTEGDSMELRYLRDTDGREIDFVVIKNRKPLFAVESKSGDKGLSSSIPYFKERTAIPSFYQVHLGKKDFGHPSTGRVLPFVKFCSELGLP